MKYWMIAEGAAGGEVLRALETCGLKPAAVLTSPPAEGEPEGLWAAVQRKGYDVKPSDSVKQPDFSESLKADGVDLLLNVYSLHVLPPHALKGARIGNLNLHPGPLPRYAGLNPVSWALYRGEMQHGVTLHWMTDEIDGGPVAGRKDFEMSASDTALSVSLKCIREGVGLIRDLFRKVEHGERLPRLVQDRTRREYHGAEIPQAGKLFWDRPASEVYNFIRACDFRMFPSPWGNPRACLPSGETLEILEASGIQKVSEELPGRILKAGAGEVLIGCASGAVGVTAVCYQGGRCPAPEILKPGMVLGNG